MRKCGNYLFLTSFFLALFGLLRLRAGAPAVGDGHLQLGLAVLVAAAGLYLRTETMAAAVVALAATGITAVVGVAVFIDDNVYVPGSLLALVAMMRIADLVGKMYRARNAAPSRIAVPVPMAPQPQGWMEASRPSVPQATGWQQDDWKQPK